MKFPLAPFKRVLTRNDGGVWGDDPAGEGDTIVLRSTDIALDGSWAIDDPALRRLNASEILSARLDIGDLVVVKSSGSAAHLGKSALVSRPVADIKPCFANFVQRLRVVRDVEPRFAWYFMNSRFAAQQLDQFGTTTTGLRNLSGETLGALAFPLPPLPVQCAIADYLDRETARIDALIAAKRRMLELLEERRKARISAIVWSSEDGSVRLKHLTPAPTSGNRDHSSFTFSDSGVACLRGLNVRPGLIDRANLLRISSPDHLRHRGTRLRHGDVVIVRSGLAGSAAVVPEDLDDCNCVDLVIVRRSPRIIPKYLEYVLNSREARAQVEQRSVGALLTHFNAVDVADLLIPFRTISRQSEVVKQLEAHESEFVQMRSLNARQMHLLQERRQALITAAVTGQLDISEAA